MQNSEKKVALQFIPIHEYTIDENTNEIKPISGTHTPDMGDDGICYTPQGLRYKQILTGNGEISYQYIQPDNSYAGVGEAIKLPNGEVYYDHKNQALYQQDFSLVKLNSSEICNIDELDCDYEYSDDK